MWILSTFEIFGNFTEFMDKFVVFKHFGTWIEVLNQFENLLMLVMDFEIFMILSMSNILIVFVCLKLVMVNIFIVVFLNFGMN